MNNTSVYLELPGYLREWITKKMGSPVRFPLRSYESALIGRSLTTLPKGAMPVERNDNCIHIIAPCPHGKPAWKFTYINERSRNHIVEAIVALFRIDMWSSILPYIQRGSVNDTIDRWCADNGISLDNREAVRQKFFRMRKAYEKYGIILGKKYSKKW